MLRRLGTNGSEQRMLLWMNLLYGTEDHPSFTDLGAEVGGEDAISNATDKGPMRSRQYDLIDRNFNSWISTRLLNL